MSLFWLSQKKKCLYFDDVPKKIYHLFFVHLFYQVFPFFMIGFWLVTNFSIVVDIYKVFL